jgi:hypothetical protein
MQISNYAQPGHRSRHNQVYWKCQPYYAFGLGAASYTRGRRFTRPKKMQAYQQWVAEYVQSGGGCPAAHLPAESQVRAAWQPKVKGTLGGAGGGGDVSWTSPAD